MPTDKVIEFVSRAEQDHMLYSAIFLPLARMIHSGSIDPEAVTRDQLVEALLALGKSNEDAFEFHVTRVEEEFRLVAHCIAEGEAKSGIVLFFTLLEGEINTLLRIQLRIRGFTPNTITDALRGTDFDTKLDVMLPLVEVAVPERMRNAALQCKVIRNLVVHNKATPSLMTDSGIKGSDVEVASERAARFFAENPVERLQKDLQKFIDDGIETNSAVRWARHLFEKYYAA
jgi:hypothetical protein